jgi:hypothetical protein
MAYRGVSGAVIERAEDRELATPPAVSSLVPNLSPAHQRFAPHARRLPACPEIDCIRHILPSRLIEAAELRAAETGVGADRVLIAWSLVSEETYVTALASSLGLAFDPLFGIPRAKCPLPDERLAGAANSGILPIDDQFVVAPRLVDSRRLIEQVRSSSDWARRIRLTSTARLQAFVTHHARCEIERRAVDELRRTRPQFSAGVGVARRMTLAACATAILLAAAAFPDVAMTTVQIVLGLVFLAWTGLRLLGLFSERLLRRRPYRFSDDWLPTYSILIALYREAAAVEGLVASLRALNYPGIMAQTPQA